MRKASLEGNSTGKCQSVDSWWVTLHPTDQRPCCCHPYYHCLLNFSDHRKGKEYRQGKLSADSVIVDRAKIFIITGLKQLTKFPQWIKWEWLVDRPIPHFPVPFGLCDSPTTPVLPRATYRTQHKDILVTISDVAGRQTLIFAVIRIVNPFSSRTQLFQISMFMHKNAWEKKSVIHEWGWKYCFFL